jgi:hypothetical protein
MRLPPPIKVERRYIVGKRMRYVLAVGNGHVIYSRGGDVHRECQVKTFLRWLRSTKRRALKTAEVT